jgi:hypothetical protein
VTSSYSYVKLVAQLSQVVSKTRLRSIYFPSFVIFFVIAKSPLVAYSLRVPILGVSPCLLRLSLPLNCQPTQKLRFHRTTSVAARQLLRIVQSRPHRQFYRHTFFVQSSRKKSGGRSGFSCRTSRRFTTVSTRVPIDE